MLYDLITRRSGKETVEMTDTFANVQQRLKTLRKSLRKGIKGRRVEFSVQPVDTSEKFRKKPIKWYR